MQSAIKSMLSPAGSVVTSPATGIDFVTDTPDVLEHVGDFMEQQNRVLSRQVLVNVTVLSVTLSADDSYGINWQAVYQALGTALRHHDHVLEPDPEQQRAVGHRHQPIEPREHHRARSSTRCPPRAPCAARPSASIHDLERSTRSRAGGRAARLSRPGFVDVHAQRRHPDLADAGYRHDGAST
ncbi:MAG: hypothetical protein WDN30_04640 [Pararobbsia sp.]